MAHYLEPRGVSVSAFARDLGISRKHLNDIVNDHVRITPAVAVRLAHALNTSPALWVNLQAAVDIYDAERAFAAERGASRGTVVAG
jgi:addiction module HigA family antidote